MLRISFTSRTVVCWLIGDAFLKAISKKELYIVKTKTGYEVRRVSDQQPVLFTKKYSLEELKGAITNPDLGWRYCKTNPQKTDANKSPMFDENGQPVYDTSVVLCALVSPNEDFELLSGPGPLEV